MPSGVWAVVWALGIVMEHDLRSLVSIASPLSSFHKNLNIPQICVYHYYQVGRNFAESNPAKFYWPLQARRHAHRSYEACRTKRWLPRHSRITKGLQRSVVKSLNIEGIEGSPCSRIFIVFGVLTGPGRGTCFQSTDSMGRGVGSSVVGSYRGLARGTHLARSDILSW